MNQRDEAWFAVRGWGLEAGHQGNRLLGLGDDEPAADQRSAEPAGVAG